jgi:uncharacterized protein YijF (DUF1287 family)
MSHCLLTAPQVYTRRTQKPLMNDERFVPFRRRLGFAALAVAVLAARTLAAPPHGADKIVAAARAQIGDVYDASYVRLAYPNGDVARGRGACTDVVIRALRRAVGHDLQRAVYADRRRRGVKQPDPNIDHRRVRNLRPFFARHAQTLTKQVTPENLAAGAWRAGDIVCWKLPGGLDHIGIVSDRKNAAGVPLVIHNIGPACREEDCLTAWPITDHFRYPPDKI